MSNGFEFKIKSEILDNETNHLNNEEDDPIVKEIDVFLCKSLENKIYLLQYPIRPCDRNYDDSKFYAAKIKPKLNKVELEIELDTKNDNYSKTKGEQYALNVDGKPTIVQTKPGSKQKQQEQQKYFKSNIMDKQVLSSTNATLGEMNRLYHLGLLKDNKLHLTQIQAILQMKPSFDYLDLVEKKTKDAKESKETSEQEYETEEDMESELEKAELVTLKYSNQINKAAQEPEQNWINLEYYQQDNEISKKLKQQLYCKKQDQTIKLEITDEEFISRLVDFNLNNEST